MHFHLVLASTRFGLILDASLNARITVNGVSIHHQNFWAVNLFVCQMNCNHQLTNYSVGIVDVAGKHPELY